MRSGFPYLRKNGNLSMPENLVMTSAYARRALAGSRGEKNSVG